MQDDPLPGLDLENLDEIEREIEREIRNLKDQRNRIDRELRRLDGERWHVRHLRNDPIGMARKEALDAITLPAMQASPIPSSKGKTVGDALRMADAWTARGWALQAALIASPGYTRWLKGEATDEDDPHVWAVSKAFFKQCDARQSAEQMTELAEQLRAGNRERIARYRAARLPVTETVS